MEGLRRVELPRHLRRRSFTTKSSHAAGLPRARRQAQDLIHVSRGLRVPADVPLRGAAALAGYVENNPRSVLSHLSAARLWGIPLPTRQDNDWRIHVANPAGTGAPRRVNVVGHRLKLAAGEIWVSDGVRFTSASRTWLDLAGSLSLRDLVAAGDHLVCGHGPDFPVPRDAICSVGELLRMVSSHPGSRGICEAPAALELIRVGADSPPETLTRLDLVEARLPEPELNVIVRDEWGRPLLWHDAAYPEYRISLQYDGSHHNNPDQYGRDICHFQYSSAQRPACFQGCAGRY